MATTKRNRRFGARLAAMSSAAILSVYATGYIATQGSTDLVSAGDIEVLTTTPAVAPLTPTSSARAAQASVTPGASVIATPSSTAAYRDGTYVGTGTSRHGSIEATVTVSAGKITAVAISQCLTRYSCDRISALPSQAVSRQSAQVDYISGATDSSKAFAQAVKNALASA